MIALSWNDALRRGRTLALLPARKEQLAAQTNKSGSAHLIECDRDGDHGHAGFDAGREVDLDRTTVHDHGTGYGIYGARHERRTAMLDWLASHGYEKDSLIGQTRYMAIDAKERGGEAWDALTGATKENVFEVGRAVTERCEVPRGGNDRRG